MTFFLTKWARKDLEKLPEEAKERIVQALHELRKSDRGDTKLIDENIWRLRVGDYRIFYGEKEDTWILKVMHRKKGYSPEMVDTLIKRLEMLKEKEKNKD